MIKKAPPSMREDEGIAHFIQAHLFSGVSRQTLRSRKHCTKCMEEITPTMPLKTSDGKSISGCGQSRESKGTQSVSTSVYGKQVWIVEVNNTPLEEGEALQLTTCPLWEEPRAFLADLGK